MCHTDLEYRDDCPEKRVKVLPVANRRLMRHRRLVGLVAKLATEEVHAEDAVKGNIRFWK
jgi:hypothetical protein